MDDRLRLRYTIVDHDKYRKAAFDVKAKPRPIEDDCGGFEYISEQWLIDLIDAGVIQLREDSVIPAGKTTGKNSREILVTDFPSLYDVIIDVEKKAGEPVFFYVHIRDLTLSFTSGEFISINKWKEKLLGLDIVLGVRGKGAHESFDEFITALVRDARTIWTDKDSEDEIYSSIILEEINKQLETRDRNNFLSGSNVRLIENGERIVKSATVSNIINYLNLPISLTKAREVLRPFLSRSSSQMRIGGKQISVWHFKEKIEENGKLINPEDTDRDINKPW